jgi:hypothetical protein
MNRQQKAMLPGAIRGVLWRRQWSLASCAHSANFQRANGCKGQSMRESAAAEPGSLSDPPVCSAYDQLR